MTIKKRKVRAFFNKHRLALFIGTAAGVFIGLYFSNRETGASEFLSPCPVTGCYIAPTPTPTNRPIPTQMPQKQVFNGQASYYSVAGCLGCSPTLTMANGEKLDDEALTLAFNMAPLNKMVTIENQRNGKKVIAKITDRGGFHKYNRIADLSLAAAKAIDLKTDTDTLTITIMPSKAGL